MQTPKGIPEDELHWARTTDRYLEALNSDFQPIRSFQGEDLDEISHLNQQGKSHIRFIPLRKWDMEDRKMDVVLIPVCLN